MIIQESCYMEQTGKMDICTNEHISILDQSYQGRHIMDFLVEQIQLQQNQISKLETKWKECKSEEATMKLQIKRLTNTVKTLMTLVPPPQPLPPSEVIPFPKIQHDKTTDPVSDSDPKTHTTLPPLRLIHPDNLI